MHYGWSTPVLFPDILMLLIKSQPSITGQSHCIYVCLGALYLIVYYIAQEAIYLDSTSLLLREPPSSWDRWGNLGVNWVKQCVQGHPDSGSGTGTEPVCLWWQKGECSYGNDLIHPHNLTEDRVQKTTLLPHCLHLEIHDITSAPWKQEGIYYVTRT